MTSKQEPPPPYGFNQQPSHVVVTQPAVAMMMPLGPESCTLTCPNCQATISSRTVKNTTTKTHLFALVLCLFMCCPCALIPYCSDCCKATTHYCPSCNAYLGSYDK